MPGPENNVTEFLRRHARQAGLMFDPQRLAHGQLEALKATAKTILSAQCELRTMMHEYLPETLEAEETN